jgi:hypothetical protein
MSWKGYVSYDTCPICGKKLFSNRELEEHLKTHKEKK